MTMNPCWIVKYAGMLYGPFWTEESAESFVEYEMRDGGEVHFVSPFANYFKGAVPHEYSQGPYT